MSAVNRRELLEIVGVLVRAVRKSNSDLLELHGFTTARVNLVREHLAKITALLPAVLPDGHGAVLEEITEEANEDQAETEKIDAIVKSRLDDLNSLEEAVLQLCSAIAKMPQEDDQRGGQPPPFLPN